MQARLQIDQTITAPDLAQALADEQGTFLVQQGGQSYIAVSKAGHSIVSLKPVGPRVPTLNIGASPENWFVTKVSEGTEFASERLEQSQRARG